jgi:hypothetical protein
MISIVLHLLRFLVQNAIYFAGSSKLNVPSLRKKIYFSVIEQHIL